ncbi:MAG: HAD family phosphatase [Vallitalea sp.]|jgi:HAD superfamily hydrolase (TIGR01509 family)|nr:HAD family phosphatase [Vallitalea sp.]
MLNNIKAVLFDLDGTLVDSMWVWEGLDIRYLSKYNINPPKTLQEEVDGMSFTETAEYFKKIFDITDSIEEIKDEWNEMAKEYYMTKVNLKDGVLDFLEYLKKNNIVMGIGSSNSTELVNLTIERHNISKYFTSVRTSCEVEKGKPAPDIYLKVAEDLNVEPEECLVFEDIPKGITAGKDAGMKVCAIYDDYSKNLDDIKRSLADYYIDDFTDLVYDNKKEA